jgi:uncharacterized sulfatase
MRYHVDSRNSRGWGLWLASVCFLSASASWCAEQPNILWISCEDISPHLGCYGDRFAITPTLDQLARRGVRYTHAFATCPVCATNRSSIITGMYPTTIGTHYMRCDATLPDHVRCFTEYLRAAGYYCSNNAKTDYNFKHPPAAWDDSSDKASWRGRQPGQPFFAVRNFTGTHESQIWPRGAAHERTTRSLHERERQDPARLPLPPYHPDTPESRRDWANYLENITQMDHDVTQLLAQLEQDGLADKTIIFFWSDHGMGLPRGKRWLYDSGTRVPLIVVVPQAFRVPGQAEPGTVSEELVSAIDLAPTVLNLAGVEIPDHCQGRAFLGRNLSPPRDLVFSTRDRMDERYDIARSARDKRYRYIRNDMPWKPYAQYLNYGDRNETMKALRRLHASGQLPQAARLFMTDHKPPEELYDTARDPHEIHNLAASDHAEHQHALARLRAALHTWADETNDLGLIPEPLVVESQRNHGNRMALLRAPEADGLMAQIRQIAIPDVRGQSLVDRCLAGLECPHAAVRYWCVVRLANTVLETPSLDPSVQSGCTDRLIHALTDNAAIVRVAAADQLCRMQFLQHGLPALIRELANPDPWIRLHAAIALDELDKRATSATAALEAAYGDRENPYVARVAERALQTLLDRPPKDL